MSSSVLHVARSSIFHFISIFKLLYSKLYLCCQIFTLLDPAELYFCPIYIGESEQEATETITIILMDDLLLTIFQQSMIIILEL